MKDKKKTKTIPRQVRWDKLDNTAHLFPSIAGESMTCLLYTSDAADEL